MGNGTTDRQAGQVDKNRLPRHIAIIMDGNGRWAKKGGMARAFGHRAGVEALEPIIEACGGWGIEALTLFAFSTENWARPKDEVAALMGLIVEYFNKKIDELDRKGVCIRMLGDLSAVPDLQRETALCAMERTKDNKGLKLNIALNYGGRQEILRGRESPPTAPTLQKQVMPGSSTEELERELIKYLVKYGDQSFDYKEGKETVQLNVADVIIGDLENNGIRLTNSAYRTIYDEYKQLWEAGEQIEMHRFINHADPTVATAIVDLLTYDDNYTASKLWQKHDIIVESEQDRLPVAVPRVVILYKSKVIETIIAELQHKLCNEELSEEELGTVTHQISALNQERILIAKKLSRLIL